MRLDWNMTTAKIVRNGVWLWYILGLWTYIAAWSCLLFGAKTQGDFCVHSRVTVFCQIFIGIVLVHRQHSSDHERTFGCCILPKILEMKTSDITRYILEESGSPHFDEEKNRHARVFSVHAHD